MKRRATDARPAASFFVLARPFQKNEPDCAWVGEGLLFRAPRCRSAHPKFNKIHRREQELS
jgi:hypothetical protein